jgi:tetratricopeptide (TPR) repeat protein
VGTKPSIFADPDAALKQARQLLSSDPKRAASQARQLLADTPGDPVLLRLLGAALRRMGKDKDAAQAEQEAIAASVRGPEHRQAAMAVAAGDRRRANAILKKLIADDENDVVALVMFGLQASLAKETEAADALLQKAVSLAPADPSARLAYAEHLQKSMRPAKALAQLEALTPEAGQGVAGLSLLAAVYRDLGRLDEEIELLRRLQEIDVSDKYLIRLGHALRTIGRPEEAVAAYRKMIASHPREGTAWWSLANLKTANFTDDDIATMKQGLEARDAPQVNRIRLSFALGKAYEDRDEPEQAYAFYVEANRLRQAIADYHPDRIRGWVDRMTRLYSREFYAERDGAGCEARDPIFIVGMQRSGSTLVEQILASHPSIEGTAELTDMPNLLRDLGDAAGRRKETMAEHVTRLPRKDLRALGQAYIDATRVHRKQGRPLFTDKMPNNWVYAHFIRLVLPNAKIVDVRRHPLACGFSNWKQLYGTGLEHTYSMDWMGQFYADYVRQMRHLDTVQPGAVHRVIYEQLVDDVEREVRRLLDYLDLPFDEACLNFHASERSVRTISAAQVRRPINREGLDQWRHYEQWLGPLKESLGSALEDWDR